MATKAFLAVAAALGCSMLASGAAWANASTTPAQGATHASATPDQGATTDTRITGEVKDKLARDFPNWADQIEVTTQNGVVTLSGYAQTTDGLQKALEDAHGVTGVTEVRNELHTR